MPCLCLLLGMVARPSLAQPPSGYLPPLPIAEEFRERQPRHNALKSALRQHFSATSLDAQARDELRDWYQQYYFRAFTDPRNFADIAKMRTDFIRSLALAKSQETRNYVMGIALSSARALWDKNYPPATRINFMLLVAELNQQDRDLGAGGNPIAIPYAAALPFMREQLKNPNQIDGVRIAALGGILRHVESQWWFMPNSQINENMMREISRDMVAMAQEETPPEGRSPDAHAWFRSRAVDVLGSLAGLVPTTESFDVMVTIAGNPHNPTWLRVRAANALARVDYRRLPAAENVDKAELAGHVAGLLADSCRLIVDRLESERTKAQTPRAGPGMGGMMGGDMGMMGADMGGMMGGDMSMMGGMMPGGMMGGARPRQDRSGVPAFMLDAVKRKLAYESSCVNAAVHGPVRGSDLKGLLAFSEGDQQALQTVSRIQEAVAKISELVADEEITLAEMVRDVRIQMQDLERLRPEPTVAAPVVAADIPGEEGEGPSEVVVPEPTAPLPADEESEEDLPDEADVPEPELPEEAGVVEPGEGEIPVPEGEFGPAEGDVP